MSLFDQFHFLEKRKEPVEGIGWRLFLVALSILIAFLIGALFFIPFNVNPIVAYKELLGYAFGTLKGFGYTIIQVSPMLLVAMGTVIAFRTGFRYLGFEGAMSMGAIGGVWFALECGENGAIGYLPPYLFFPLVVLVSFAFGGAWAAIVGISKAKLGGNEIIVSLMTNYIAFLLLQYVVSGPLRAAGDQPQTAHIPPYTMLPIIIPGTQVHAGVIFTAVIMVITFFLMRNTPLGYRLIMTGSNPKSAKYSGINTAKMIIIAALIAGGLAGIAGAGEVLGVQYRLLDGVTSDIGRLGIIAALLAGLHPYGSAAMSFFYAGMWVGGQAMQRRMGVPSPVVFTIQTLVVLIMVIVDVLRQYRVVLPWRKTGIEANQ